MPIRLSHWMHIVFNFIGPNDGQGYRVYHDGKLVENVTEKFEYRFRPMGRRIIIGADYADYYFKRFSSLEMDQLLLFNRFLYKTEVAVLSQTNF